MTLTDTLKVKAAEAINANLTGQQPSHGAGQHSTPSGPTPWPSTGTSQAPPQSYPPYHHSHANNFNSSAQSQSYAPPPGPPGGYQGPPDQHGTQYNYGPPSGPPPRSNIGASVENFLTGSKSSASNPNRDGKTNYAGIAEKFLLGTNHKDKKDPWGLGGGGWTGLGGGGESSKGHGHKKSDPWGLGTKEDWLGTKEDWGLGGKGKDGKLTKKELKDLEDAQDAMDAADIAKQIKADGGEIDEDTAEAIVQALVGV